MSAGVCSVMDCTIEPPLPEDPVACRRPRVVFFCGDRSRYGLAHLEPVLDTFDVAAVVLATDDRWARFHCSLTGQAVPRPGPATRARRALKALVPVPLLRVRTRLLNRSLDARTILRDRSVARLDVADVNDPAFLTRLGDLHPDLVVAAAYPQIFEEPLLKIACRGAVNFHPSLLPAYRGAHPHFWVIARGERQSGVTSHFMTPDLDAGDIIEQIQFPIDGYTYSQLYDRIVAETSPLVGSTAAFFASGFERGRPQATRGRSQFRNDRPIHRRIFWCIHRAEEVENLSRTERAFCFFRGRQVVCLGARERMSNRNLTNAVEVEGGTILDLTDRGVTVQAADRTVEIAAFRDGERGRACPAARWIRRHKPRIGEKLA